MIAILGNSTVEVCFRPRSPLDANSPLTAAEYNHLAAVPPEAEWFANLDNPGTRRGYENDIQEFMRFIGIAQAAEFRTVTRATSSSGVKT